VILIAADDEADQAAAVLKRAMEAGAAEFLQIPLSVDVGIGDSWGTAKV
jgi:DNA polymerase I-like protein with 3'-5' exonuclease and polymerase domains